MLEHQFERFITALERIATALESVDIETFEHQGSGMIVEETEDARSDSEKTS